MRLVRRAMFEEEGPVAVEAVAALGRGKPLRAQIPETDSA
jgi:hypothetical protein